MWAWAIKPRAWPKLARHLCFSQFILFHLFLFCLIGLEGFGFLLSFFHSIYRATAFKNEEEKHLLAFTYILNFILISIGIARENSWYVF